MSNILLGLDGYMVLNQTQTSDYISIGHAEHFGVQVIVDNTDAVGKLTVEASNNRTDWVTLWWVKDGYDKVMYDGYNFTSGNRVNHIFSCDNISCGWIRLKYVRTSGTGGLTFSASAKR